MNYEKGTVVFFTTYSLNRIADMSQGFANVSVDDCVGVGVYSRTYGDNYHHVWVEKDKCFVVVSDRDLHPTKEAADKRLIDYIEFHRNYLNQQITVLDQLQAELTRGTQCSDQLYVSESLGKRLLKWNDGMDAIHSVGFSAIGNVYVSPDMVRGAIARLEEMLNYQKDSYPGDLEDIQELNELIEELQQVLPSQVGT